MHSPQTKAAAVTDLLLGMSTNEVAKKYKVAKSTVGVWLVELKESEGRTPLETKQTLFEASLERFAVATMDMLAAQAALLTDHEYLRKQAVGDVIEFSGFVADRLNSIIKITQPTPEQRGTPQALPGGSWRECEVIDADAA